MDTRPLFGGEWPGNEAKLTIATYCGSVELALQGSGERKSASEVELW